MLPKLLNLKPDRAQLNPNFDGYKLSLEKLEVLTTNVSPGVDRVLPSADQYSLLYAKLFGTHNHLVGEVADGSVRVYFVDKNSAIRKVCGFPKHDLIMWYLISRWELTATCWS